MKTPLLTDLQAQVVTALVEGYQARAGMKDRIRALNEWEIARRAGVSDVSYAEFFEHPSRELVLNALMVLQRYGLVSVWERGVKYDTFVPTERGEALLAGGRDTTPGKTSVEPTAREPAPTNGEASVLAPSTGNADAILDRLDEIVRLLRSIDARLGGV